MVVEEYRCWGGDLRVMVVDCGWDGGTLAVTFCWHATASRLLLVCVANVQDCWIVYSDSDEGEESCLNTNTLSLVFCWAVGSGQLLLQDVSG